MEKYEMYKLTAMNGNEWKVLQLNEQIEETEIDKICNEFGIDEVKYPS